MASLVADYSSDSESSFDSDRPEVISNKVESKTLPRPDFKTSSEVKSVFVNPFVAADNAKTAILEKHVKMISTDVKTVNGKKICWNYRKNKCRFGHNCKYAHDSDVQIDQSKKKSESVNRESNFKQLATDTNKEETNSVRNRKRMRCENSFINNGKVMKTTELDKL